MAKQVNDAFSRRNQIPILSPRLERRKKRGEGRGNIPFVVVIFLTRVASSVSVSVIPVPAVAFNAVPASRYHLLGLPHHRHRRLPLVSVELQRLVIRRWVQHVDHARWHRLWTNLRLWHLSWTHQTSGTRHSCRHGWRRRWHGSTRHHGAWKKNCSWTLRLVNDLGMDECSLRNGRMFANIEHFLGKLRSVLLRQADWRNHGGGGVIMSTDQATTAA